jgi:hypothetical protein
MARKSLDKDKQRFAEWRSQRRRCQPIPDELWRTAFEHIPALGLNRVAQEFHLSFSRLRDKAQQAGISVPKPRRDSVERQSEVAFQELPLDRMLLAPPSGLCLVLERPDGLRVRIEGHLPDADYVGKLAACLLR